MIQADAAKILGLDGQITPDMVKAAFRKAAKKYHPDINPAGLKMMQIVNEAFDCLKDFTGSIDEVESGAQNYPEELNAALNAIIGLAGLDIEVCGSWIWVGGNTKAHKDVLKAAGFKWANKKKKWNFRPAAWRSFSNGKSTMNDIRAKYGSTRPGYHGPAQIGGAA